MVMEKEDLIAIFPIKIFQSLNDHSLSTMKKTHEEMLAEQRRQYEEQIAVLHEEHAAELQEEKKATRFLFTSSFYAWLMSSRYLRFFSSSYEKVLVKISMK